MESITVREVNSEVNVWLNYNYSTKLAALQAATRALSVEVLREQSRVSRDLYRECHNDGIPECPTTD